MADVSREGLTRSLPIAGGASFALVPPASRLVFRGSPEAARLCGDAFGPALPSEACRATEAGERAALWLGPDEWLLLAPEGEGEGASAAIESALAGVPHALVDVSHRQVGIDVVGVGAADLLNAGCPLDLDLTAFPVGTCTRTVLAKCEIVLWRRAAPRFRLELNRSFARYATGLLADAARGL